MLERVQSEPGRVRSQIGYVSQLGGADDLATGRENLVLKGRLYREGAATVNRRAQELIDLLDLAPFADRGPISGATSPRCETAGRRSS